MIADALAMRRADLLNISPPLGWSGSSPEILGGYSRERYVSCAFHKRPTVESGYFDNRLSIVRAVNSRLSRVNRLANP
jgi:hypothetical protein